MKEYHLKNKREAQTILITTAKKLPDYKNIAIYNYQQFYSKVIYIYI
jgi:hypothetical protein